ncbi:MAG: F0F1 ATP synthase subunit delta [Deltaproteobacteria bacterium]|nr:F0F1 ATP synthase subunit delta [Deltaproteobacteria bacterium]
MTIEFIAGFLLIQVLVFAVVIIFLRRLMVKDTLSAVNRLKLVDDENAKRLSEMKTKIEEAEEEYRRKVEQTTEDVRRQREEAKKELEEERGKMLAKAREESDRIVSGAKKLEAKAVQRMAMEVEAKAAVVGAELVRIFVGARMEKGLDEQLACELIEEIRAMDAGRVSVDFDEIGIVSRSPLSSAHKTEIKNILEKKTGRKLSLKEELKKDFAGGIILKLGSLILDGSVENRIKEAAGMLKKGNL